MGVVFDYYFRRSGEIADSIRHSYEQRAEEYDLGKRDLETGKFRHYDILGLEFTGRSLEDIL